MKLLKFNTILLLIILALGLTLRVCKLDSVPPGLTWDEAALGYNAYSLSKTFRDEYGFFLPLTLKSFGDYKPALYAYLDIPFVVTLGLNEWAVRLPSVLAGIGFILICYLIILEIFKDKALSLSVAFFAAISPLSIQFSRAGFESNVAVFLNVLGLYFFLGGLKSSKYFYFASVSLILSMLCYQGSKMYAPIILIGFFLFFRKQVKIDKNVLVSLVAVIIAVAGIYTSTFLLGQSDRLEAQNVFAYRRDQAQINQIAVESDLQPGS
ncbi:MAG TPA: glycosyltransferase family 39 protein, partial [Patescibacteria group bacterium]|nr:glycosyltransferase family 39 protein [Patescibacteria group bacterium]